MGAITSAIKNLTANENQVKEQLEILLVAAKGKLQAYRDEINEQFLNSAKIDKLQIPGIRAIRFIEQYHVSAQDGFSDKVKEHLDQAIDAFFSIGGKDADNKKAVQDGIKALIEVGIDAIIGSSEAGEQEKKIYIVVPENNAFVRVDICVWKYHMETCKIHDKKQTAVAYLLCKSVIDHTKLKLDELIYLVSEALSKRPKKFVHLTVTRKFPPEDKPGSYEGNFRSIDGINPLLKDKTKEHDAYENLYEYTVDMESTPGGSPPSIVEVEAYIEELIRVWEKLNVEKRQERR